MVELKPCPFCGHLVMITDVEERYLYITIKAQCSGCGMEFEHTQSFAKSKTARVALNESFDTVWNRRADDGK